MNWLDDDDNTDFSFFEMTQNALDLAITVNLMLLTALMPFPVIGNHIIFGVANVLCYLLVLLRHQNSPLLIFLFLEEVALAEATIHIIIAGNSSFYEFQFKPLNEAVSLEGCIYYFFFFINPLLACRSCQAGPSVISEHLEQSGKLYISAWME